MLGLRMAFRAEARICRAIGDFASFRECMTDQEQFHNNEIR